MKNNIHTLIFPDIHGRTFWKETLNKFPINEYPNLKIIFLGDYLDPYEFEYISKQDAILNFEDIIKTTKSDNRITLLLGNHDYHYIHDGDYSRIDYNNYNYIKRLFDDNFNLFKIAYEETINDKTYLYTHAGVTSHWLNHLRFLGNICLNNNHISEEQKEWIKEHLYEFELTADNLNALLYNFQGMAILHEVSYERGGDFQNGSCIWADIVEHLYNENKNEYINNIFQIFGHSLRYPSIDEGYIDYDNNYAMLDSRNSWVLYNNGKLEIQN
jgi:predicted phosphodiesterase